jgi:DNA-nicking Smr family endonuclease
MARKLRSEEWELWRRVADTAIPIQPLFHIGQQGLAKVRNTEKKTPRMNIEIKDFKIGQISKQAIETKGAAVPKKKHHKMDAKAFGKLTRGKTRPEAVLDLHGMTLVEAQPALHNFILGSVQLDRRLVLVITGKGRPKVDYGPIPVRHGVLRENVPIWLRQLPLSSVILDVTTAHQRHGGGGAIYVYLKKKR